MQYEDGLTRAQMNELREIARDGGDLQAALERMVDPPPLDEDLKEIITAVRDLAFYRTVAPETARDLQVAVWHELVDRVRELPEADA